MYTNEIIQKEIRKRIQQRNMDLVIQKRIRIQQWEENKDTDLYLQGMNLIEFPNCVRQIPNLRFLYCDHNKLKELPDLSFLSSLEILTCCYNELNELPNLPINLKHLTCSNNQLKSIPNLPPNLKNLYCSENEIAKLPDLPVTLIQFDCSNNKLKKLPNLPLTLF